jgi:hypothetical protein
MAKSTNNDGHDAAPVSGIENRAENATARAASAPLYAATDLAAKARTQFGTMPEVVAAALKTAGKDKASLDDAKRLIREFLSREVK